MPSVVSNPNAAAPVVSAPPRASGSIQIRLRATPGQARIAVDDGMPQPAPVLLDVSADGKPHRIRASSPGYHDSESLVIFDESREVSIKLEPIAVPSRQRLGRAAAPLPSAPASLEPAATPQRTTPGDLPAVTPKPRRTLDSDNPFSQ